jgi:hypothetical protein
VESSIGHPTRQTPSRHVNRSQPCICAIRKKDGRQIDCELPDHGTFGWEGQLLEDLKWFYGHICGSCALAETEAEGLEGSVPPTGFRSDPLSLLSTSRGSGGQSACPARSWRAEALGLKARYLRERVVTRLTDPCALGQAQALFYNFRAGIELDNQLAKDDLSWTVVPAMTCQRRSLMRVIASLLCV